MDQLKFTVVLTVPSKAERPTAYSPTEVGVPVMRPVVASTLSPAGRPMALKLKALPSGSDAVAGSSTAAPTVLDWLPGFERFGAVLTKVVIAWRHCRPTLSIQPPARPYSAKPGLPESQRQGPCAVPVMPPTAPRKVPVPVSLPPEVSGRHSKSSWSTYVLKP